MLGENISLLTAYVKGHVTQKLYSCVLPSEDKRWHWTLLITYISSTFHCCQPSTSPIHKYIPSYHILIDLSSTEGNTCSKTTPHFSPSCLRCQYFHLSFCGSWGNGLLVRSNTPSYSIAKHTSHNRTTPSLPLHPLVWGLHAMTLNLMLGHDLIFKLRAEMMKWRLSGEGSRMYKVVNLAAVCLDNMKEIYFVGEVIN